MADESLDEILSSSIPAATPEPVAAEIPVEQPAPAEGAVRDEHGRFAPKAPATPETPAQPNATATPEPEGNGTVPQQALHEARQREKAERERGDRLEQAILALQRPATPTPPVEQPKPVELWDDPDKWGASLVDNKLTPLQEEIANTRAFYSDRDALREHGAELVGAAKAALGDAIKSGTMDDAKVTAFLKRSMDPVGEIVAWHKGNLNKQRIGNDPDAFVQAEIDRLAADPAQKAALIARLTGAPAPVGGQTPASVTPNIPRSINRLPGGTTAPITGDESIDDILKTRPRRG